MYELNYKLLEKMIEESGIKKGVIAQRMHVSTRTFTDSLFYKRLTVDYLLQICTIIGHHPCEFFTGPPPPQNIVNDVPAGYRSQDLIELLKNKDEQIKMLFEQLNKRT